jgi:hypothetical protein
MELGSRQTIWLVAKGEGAVAPVVAARAAERWVAVALAVKVGQVVAAKVVVKWAAAEKWEAAREAQVAVVKVVGRWAVAALGGPAAACKIMQSLLKT